jgi:hypothetical protein
MANKTVYVDGTSSPAGHYATLQAAITGEVGANPNLVTMAGILNIEISRTTADTTSCTVNGFTTNPSYYVNIYTTPAARNMGGPWDATKYRISVATNYARALIIYTPYTRVTGLQFETTNATTLGTGAVALLGATNVLIANCRMRAATTATTATGAVLYFYSGYTNSGTVRNCVIYGSAGTPGITSTTTTTVTLENCTVYVPNATYAIYKGGTVHATNCYLGGPADTIYGTLNTATKIATSDASGSEAGLRNIAAATGSGAYFTNVTPGTEDFSLGASSALIGVGADLSGTFQTDIVGTDRGTTFDIGAFEGTTAVLQYARPVSDVSAGGWTPDGTSQTLAEAIGETDVNDTTYIRSESSPSGDTCTVQLSSLTVPSPGSVILHVRARTL